MITMMMMMMMIRWRTTSSFSLPLMPVLDLLLSTGAFICNEDDANVDHFFSFFLFNQHLIEQNKICGWGPNVDEIDVIYFNIFSHQNSFLKSKSLVVPDLAARNCLLTQQCLLKVHFHHHHEIYTITWDWPLSPRCVKKLIASSLNI